MDWLVETIGPAAATVVTWMVAVLVVLVLLLLVLRMLRGLLPGIYVRGGKSRHRLAVVDAAPVDANRRLILVRRDEVEHLLLIGGSGDVIVETGIGAPALQAQPAPRVQEAQSIARQQPSTQLTARSTPAEPPAESMPAEPPARSTPAGAPPAPAPRPAQSPAHRNATGSAPSAASATPSPAAVARPHPGPAGSAGTVTPVPAPQPHTFREAFHTRRPVDTGSAGEVPAPHDIRTTPPQPSPVTAPRHATMPVPSAGHERQTDPHRPVRETATPDVSGQTRGDDGVSEEDLMRELQETLAPVRQSAAQSRPQQPAAQSSREMSLEEEMSQLLQDLTREGKA